jgi:hypothetical protein
MSMLRLTIIVFVAMVSVASFGGLLKDAKIVRSTQSGPTRSEKDGSTPENVQSNRGPIIIPRQAQPAETRGDGSTVVPANDSDRAASPVVTGGSPGVSSGRGSVGGGDYTGGTVGGGDDTRGTVGGGDHTGGTAGGGDYTGGTVGGGDHTGSTVGGGFEPDPSPPRPPLLNITFFLGSIALLSIAMYCSTYAARLNTGSGLGKWAPMSSLAIVLLGGFLQCPVSRILLTTFAPVLLVASLPPAAIGFVTLAQFTAIPSEGSLRARASLTQLVALLNFAASIATLVTFFRRGGAS